MFKRTMWMLSLLLAGCGAGNQASNSSSSLNARDTVFGDDIKAMDKARGVQGTLMKDKTNTDAAIDATTDTATHSSAE